MQILINVRHSLANLINIIAALFAERTKGFGSFTVVASPTSKSDIVKIMRSTSSKWINMVKFACIKGQFLVAVNALPTLMLHFQKQIIGGNTTNFLKCPIAMVAGVVVYTECVIAYFVSVTNNIRRNRVTVYHSTTLLC